MPCRNLRSLHDLCKIEADRQYCITLEPKVFECINYEIQYFGYESTSMILESRVGYMAAYVSIILDERLVQGNCDNFKSKVVLRLHKF